jgi:hypothetical protein
MAQVEVCNISRETAVLSCSARAIEFTQPPFFGTMSTFKGKLGDAIEMIAPLEVQWSKLRQDYDSATYRQNSLVLDSIEKAGDDLALALERLFKEEFDSALRLVQVAALRIDFGRKIFEADAIEHFLGESDYLDLTQSKDLLDAGIDQLFDELEKEVLRLQSAIDERMH